MDILNKTGQKYHLTKNGYRPCQANVRDCQFNVHGYFKDHSAAKTAYNNRMKEERDIHKSMSRTDLVKETNLELLDSPQGQELIDLFYEDPNTSTESALTVFHDRATQTLRRANDKQKKALYVYTEDGPDYRYLNKALREDDLNFLENETDDSRKSRDSPLYRNGDYPAPPPYRFKDLADDLDSLFTDENKLDSPMPLFRGLTMKDSFMGESAHEFHDRLMTVGEEFTLNGYTSTSPNFHQASIFTTPDQELVLEMITDKGVTWHRTEMEHLLPRNTTWVVVGSEVVEQYGHEYLTVKVIDKDLLRD